MRTKTERLTDTRAQALPVPDKGYTITWCPDEKGLGVRVTSAGGRAWVFERRLHGKTVRRTLGPANGRGAISRRAAVDLMHTTSGELQGGRDRMIERREQRTAERTDAEEAALTLAAALRAYVAGKRRAKDKLPLKERTVVDYLAMIEGPRSWPADMMRKDGQPHRLAGKPIAAGELFALAAKPLAEIDATDIRAVYDAAAKRSQRRATYAMQVLRAVLNWHGYSARIEANPLDRSTAGKDRIVLGKTAGAPNPIPPERLAAWWRAAAAREDEAADLYKLMLLTGARGGELKTALVSDADRAGGRLVLRDTKNRTDHVVYLSKQAAAIIERRTARKKPTANVFEIADGGRTLDAINAAAGVRITPHDLRSTFASVAEELVSAYTLKKLLNHALTGDVTGGHYIGKSETQLRTAWQTVADFITKTRGRR